ncbi:MYST -like histone acetyltransferase [Carpediemonas membranifera]|uniref:histone acetyltransferase n=1 Tax=Carpediemonas membranifera TaxID=201153 RepID=A0A8J6E266_9EUKA|nr:MYST -like histone acetyltransferase [Carpediemonas membranifera]|eukprot:KAG9397239.1 MYST -like histone acetyltransferase [Carpediemonas membranifera]
MDAPEYPVGSHADGLLIEGSKFDWQEVIILKKRTDDGIERFYVSYVAFNKRLDTWLTRDCLAPLHKHTTETMTPAPKTPAAKTTKSAKSLKSIKGSTKQTKQSQSTVAAADAHDDFEKIIDYIVMGAHKLKTWYASPYQDVPKGVDTLWICPICFRYHFDETSYTRHAAKCTAHHPPGDEIYRMGNLSFFEVDGRVQKQFCRNLCLCCKLFLDHKKVVVDTDLFLFYCLTETTPMGCQTVGFFSKTFDPEYRNILACILTLPQHQKKGFGKVLIDFSYALAKREGRFGGPEKPLSDLGKISFLSYWRTAILQFLYDPANNVEEVTIDDICTATQIQERDVVETLATMGICRRSRGDESKGVMVCLPHKRPKRMQRLVSQAKLHWTPLPRMTYDPADRTRLDIYAQQTRPVR